jgi:UDP-glucose 4-epimerase
MPRVLITGGAGFIGSHVIESFFDAGYEVEVLDDLSSGTRENVRDGVALHVLDVAYPEAARLVANGRFDVVAHLAAQMDVRRSVEDPMFDARTNIIGSLNVLEAVRRLDPAQRPRVVFASTGGALYGDAAKLPSSEESPANPDAPYGVAKLSIEYYLGYYARIWGLETVVLRFGNVYGPRQDPHGEAGVVAIFCQRLAEGQPMTIYGTGRQTRDFIFVGDVADAFFAASTAPLPAAGPLTARAFNIGTGVETSVLDLAHMLAKAVDVEPKIDFRPARSGEVERSLLDATKAERELGWKATVSLTDGLSRSFAWTRSRL